MAEMAAAARAMDRRPHHAEGGILLLADRARQRRPETRPAGAALELGGRGEQVEVAARAGEIAAPMLVEQRAGVGTLGPAFPQDRKLLRRQELAPVGGAVHDREVFGGPRSGAPPRQS